MRALTDIAATLRFETPLKPNADAGDKGVFQWIAPEHLYIDESYQRSIETNGKRNVRAIVEQFRYARFSPLKVSQRAPKMFAVMDGQHKGVAAILHGAIALVPCYVHTLNTDEEADAFATINGNLTRLQPMYLFRARVASGDAKANAAAKAAAQAGVRIMPYPVAAHQLKPGETLACGTIEGCLARYGREALIAGLTCITKTGDGNTGLVKADLIEAFAQAFYFQPKWLAAANKARRAVDQRSVKTLLSAAARAAASTGGGIRKALIVLVDKLFLEELGDGGSRPKLTLSEKERYKAKAGMPLRSLELAKCDAAAREQDVIRASKVRAAPKQDGVKAQISADERAMIEAHLKAKGARKLEQGATGDRYHLLAWLQRRGIKIEYAGAGGAKRLRWQIGKRILDAAKFDDLVNAERKKDGLEPLKVSA